MNDEPSSNEVCPSSTRSRTHTRAFRDLLVLLFVAGVALILTLKFNIAEVLHGWTRQHENNFLQPDEVIVVLAITAFAFAIFALRRWRELRVEMTERTHAETALKRQERYSQSLIENTSDIVSVINAEGIIRYENPSIERTLGYKPDELIGKNAFDFVHPDDVAGLKALFVAGLKTPGQISTGQYRFLHKDGSWRALDGVGTNLLDVEGVNGVLITSREVTERRLMEQILRDSEQRLKEAQAAAKVGDWEFDFATQRITWSDQIYVLFERNPELGPPTYEELLGHFLPADSVRLQKLVQHAIQTGHEFETDLRLKLPSGKERYMLSVGIPVKDSDGKVTKLRGIGQDITERKRTETALAESERKYRVLVEQSADAIIACDDHWNIRFANSAACDMTGYAPEEFQQLSVLDTYAPEDRVDAIRRWQALHVGQTVRFERNVRQKTGSHFPAEVILRRVEEGRFQGIIRDITERKRAEESLRLQSTALEAAANGIVITDRNGTILWVNAAFTTLSGYAAEEVIGQNPRILKSGQHDAAFYRKMHDTIQSGQVWHGEIVNRRKDGSLYTEEMTITPVRDDKGEISRFVAIKQDVTERKHAEQSLRELQRQQRALLDNIPDIVCVKDKESRYVAVNEALSKAYGHKPEEIVGKSDFDMVPRELAERYRADDKRVMESRQRERIEEPFEDAAGSRTWIDTIKSPIINDRGEVIGTAGIARDFTARKNMEEALRASEERYRSLFETMREGLALCEIICDDAGKPCDFRYLEVNAAFEEIIGIRRNEAINKTARELFPQIEGYWIDIYGKVALTGAPAHFENYLQALNKHFAVAAFSPRPGQFAAIFVDITERKRTDETLRETNRRLENALAELKAAEQQVIQQERLRALGTMASGVAHDFNNALAAILGFTELLLHKPEVLDNKEKARRYIEMMNVAAQDAGKVVDRLREFYRHRDEAEVFASVDINRLVNEAAALTQPKWKPEAEIKGISINVRTELQGVPPVAGNAQELREVLTNLIFNAVDAMPRGGTITIRTRRDDGHIVLEIADTGTGMTEEVRRRCLEPFFTTKGERGTGLGLSMVYGILQRHEGTIDIQTELGKGTTFIIRLPHHEPKPQAQQPDCKTQPGNPALSLHVLIVDDEAVVRKIVGEYLKIDGHTVEAANSGRDGLEKFRHGQFDLVLVDRAMPDMNGDQVAAAIKSANPTVPVVMLTGFGTMMDAAAEKPAGVDLIVGKPVTIAGLRTALSKVVASAN